MRKNNNHPTVDYRFPYKLTFRGYKRPAEFNSLLIFVTKIILAKYPSIEKLQHLRLTQPKRAISELSERARLLEQTHLLGHFGIDAFVRAPQSRGIIWPCMRGS